MNELMQKKIDQGREYRKMTMDVRSDLDEYMVEGYATTFDQPYHLYYVDDEGHELKEQVSKDAFRDTDMSDTIMQYDHEGRVFARISNDTLQLSVDDHGLLIRAYLGGTEMGRNLYEEIKGGYTNKMSFGFTVTDDEIREDGRDYLRTIKSIGKLYDVSAVSLPANDFTEISARSHCDGVIAEIEAERLRLEDERRAAAEKRESLAERLKALKGEKNGD
ncbi:MAG: HK97 family phage prohead protease [Lachnospiraceae bacterium]|nr:HK97 family phage prohead protease [Lachnospiraceae bacterium]